MVKVIKKKNNRPSSDTSFAIKAVKHLLAKACKRFCLVLDETKAALVERLDKVSVKTKADSETQAQKYDTNGLKKNQEILYRRQ